MTSFCLMFSDIRDYSLVWNLFSKINKVKCSLKTKMGEKKFLNGDNKPED